jgi:hypothetical protein
VEVVTMTGRQSPEPSVPAPPVTVPADGSSSVNVPRVGVRSAILGLGARRRFERRLAGLDLHHGDDPGPPVTESDLVGLPEPARRYLRAMGVVGRRRDRWFRARFRGGFRMKPGQAWMPYESWQYDAADPVTRVVDMRIDAAGVLPMFGTDTYLAGEGRMRGRLFGLVTVAEGGGREFDLGELVTYLNDAAMLAPSMLLTPNVQWMPHDQRSFDVTITDRGNTVSARFFVDPTGRLIDFRTDDRWYAGSTPPRRTTWSTPIDGWTTLAGGRPVPTDGSATWHLPEGEFSYVRGSFDPSSIEFDGGTAGKG